MQIRVSVQHDYGLFYAVLSSLQRPVFGELFSHIYLGTLNMALAERFDSVEAGS